MPPIRNGHWITTYSGQKFWPLDPRPEEINFIDIAHALSMLCRWGGHVRRFYSVAEHCVHVCRAAPLELKREALLHDASEAYLVDMPRPVKKMMPEYRTIEARLERAIANKFTLVYPWPAEVKRIDNCMLLDEQIALCNGAVNPIEMDDAKALGTRIEGWTPGIAEIQFMSEFYTWFV